MERGPNGTGEQRTMLHAAGLQEQEPPLFFFGSVPAMPSCWEIRNMNFDLQCFSSPAGLSQTTLEAWLRSNGKLGLVLFHGFHVVCTVILLLFGLAIVLWKVTGDRSLVSFVPIFIFPSLLLLFSMGIQSPTRKHKPSQSSETKGTARSRSSRIHRHPHSGSWI